jgi:hypothetical protein
MATSAAFKNKVFVELGVVPVNKGKGIVVSVVQYIVMRESFAKYIGAKYLAETPKAKESTIKRGKLNGRKSTREQSARLTGRPFALGYYDETTTSASGQKGIRKIKWIPIYIPKGMTLLAFLKAFLPKITRKPAFLRTPAGVSTRFNNVD